jgi:hypothetical protein
MQGWDALGTFLGFVLAGGLFILGAWFVLSVVVPAGNWGVKQVVKEGWFGPTTEDVTAVLNLQNVESVHVYSSVTRDGKKLFPVKAKIKPGYTNGETKWQSEGREIEVYFYKDDFDQWTVAPDSLGGNH